MSRSNPTTNTPNPAQRWYEWNGGSGTLRYYDKAAGKNIEVPLPFTCVLLDELSGVGGWHDASKSGIFSNAVRDTTQAAFVVKAFKGGPLVEGMYREIKDRIKSFGGHFEAIKYVAWKDEAGEFQIGAVKFKGAALGAWMEFANASRREVYQQAIQITGAEQSTKGKVDYYVPVFALKPLSDDTHEIAVALDAELQTYLTGYLAQSKDVPDTLPMDADDEPPPPEDAPEPATEELYDDNIPF